METAALSSPCPAGRTVAIAGGGVIGVCCAYYLAKRGARVTLLDRKAIGEGASYGNAGSIAPGHAPINKPGQVSRALRSVFHPLSPLYIVPRPDLGLARWLWRFSRTCTHRHLEAAMRTIAPLGHATRELFDQLAEEENLECGYRRDGYYEVYLTARGFEAGRREARLQACYGFHPEVLSGDALREREPALNREVVGGVFYPEAATVDPYRFVVELARRAERRGATIRTEAQVARIRVNDRTACGLETRAGELVEAEATVLAAGADSAALLRPLGVRLPLEAAKGYHRDCASSATRPPMLRHACVLGENLVFCTPMSGFVRFAGTLEFSGLNREIRRPRLEQLTRAARRYLNTVEEATFRSEWCGLRPCLPDGLPAVGPVPPYRGLFLATGHAMMGLTLGPITGKLIAETILDGRPSLDIEAFCPGRFGRKP